MRTAETVLANFKSVIEAIAPTDQTPQCAFSLLASPLSADQSSGTTRGVRVLWEGSSPSHPVEDMSERCADHKFVVVVAYSTKWEEYDLQTIMLRDRNDLVTALRETDNYCTGLWGRWLEDEKVERGAITWNLRQTWRCTIDEVE